MTPDPIMDIDAFQAIWGVLCEQIDTRESAPYTVKEIADIKKPGQPPPCTLDMEL